MNLVIFFATMDPLQALPGMPEAPETDQFSGNLAVLAFAALVVIMFVAAWALFIRKPQRTVGLTPEEAAASVSKTGRKRKVKQRFPTLSETGGLPPAKS